MEFRYICSYLPSKAQNHQLVVQIGLSALRDLKIMLWRLANIMMRLMLLMRMMMMVMMLMMMKVIMMRLKVSPVPAKSRCTRGCLCIFLLSLSENQIFTIKYYILIYLHFCLNFQTLCGPGVVIFGYLQTFLSYLNL